MDRELRTQARLSKRTLTTQADIGNTVYGTEVHSVNGKAGHVVLDAEDVGALPSDTPIPSLDGYATEEWVQEQGYATPADIPTDVSAFNNDAGYLTQHQDLSDYALKSELPTVPTEVSAFTNDAGYLSDAYFVITATADDDTSTVYTPDCTFAEAWAAFQSGKILLLKLGLTYIHSGFTSSALIRFSTFNGTYNRDYTFNTTQKIRKTSETRVLSEAYYIIALSVENGNYVPDHTFTEAVTAYQSGKQLVLKNGNDVIQMSSIDPAESGYINFAKVTNNTYTRFQLLYDNQVSRTNLLLARQDAIPTAVSQLTNDAGYLTSHQDISGKADKTEVSALDTRVTAVEDSVSNLFGSKSSNLFNRYDESSVTTQKYYTTTGEKASSSSWSTADIDVHQYDKVEYNGLSSEGSAAVVSCWLDENKGFLSYFKQHTGKNTIDVPAGAYYVGFSINRSQDVLNAFVVYGISNGRIDDIEVETAQNTADIASISAGISDFVKVVPDYFDSQLATKIPAIIANMNEAGSNGETFVFITDIHWETNYKNSPALVDYVLKHTKVQNVFSGGDLINEGDNSTMMATLIECIRSFQFPLADNFFPVARGNHDDNSNWSSAEDIASHEFDYNTVRSLVCNQVVNKVTFLTNTEHSFYFDHEQSKTRFVFIDTRRNGTVSNFPSTALNTLLLATPQDYKLVFIAHYLYASSFKSGAIMLMNMVSAFNAKTTGSYSGVNFDYTNTNGKAVCIIGGHTHFDIDWEKDDTTNGNISGVPIIITDTDSYRNHSGTEGTADSQCFDVMTINYSANTIKCVRIGRGSDRSFTFD